ncbi:MAG: hypothetical protein QF632_01890 [Candidatus Woesearchaeota archaeon]|jgi:hypothetical protein|nr:hypothetical protein [Candidatus Woesearchaeota archaeon]MDP7457975.1 hypothetical protein [Candidatus Woesearchaeota archaeon]|tara:strand:+ start:172 stop:675 length:504 start_codon:yes stop_codon:yes gene_type:complete
MYKGNNHGIREYSELFLSKKEMEALPYFSILKEIRATLENELIDYPACQCTAATRSNKLIIGLVELAGDYTYDMIPIINDIYRPDCSRKLTNWHAWNYDPQRRLFIDTNQDQFGEGIPSIVIMRCPSLMLVPNKDATLLQLSWDIDELAGEADLEKVIEKIRGNIAA